MKQTKGLKIFEFIIGIIIAAIVFFYGGRSLPGPVDGNAKITEGVIEENVDVQAQSSQEEGFKDATSVVTEESKDNKDSSSGTEYRGSENILQETPEYLDWVKSFDPTEYAGENYQIVNGNIPFFTEDDRHGELIFEHYNDLDKLGRCRYACARLAPELMPTGERDRMYTKPTGWHQYFDIADSVENDALYNRSHLIAYALADELDNPLNLITGTEYFNQTLMNEYEKLVLDYINATGNRVSYRVTPLFVGDELVARGVLMEAWSCADNGQGVSFCVYCPNVQPGVIIDYATGKAEKKNN